MPNPNPIEAQKDLKGVNYPADRNALVEQARSNGADDAVIQALQQLPDGTYDGPDQVSHELSS